MDVVLPRRKRNAYIRCIFCETGRRVVISDSDVCKIIVYLVDSHGLEALVSPCRFCLDL